MISSLQSNHRLTTHILAFCFVVATVPLSAIVLADQKPAEKQIKLDAKLIRESIAKAIPLLEKASAGSAEQRTCFTCHTQALPIMAFSEAKKRGFDVDEPNFARQMLHTSKHLDRGKKKYGEGKGQGGQVLTAGYALWALEAGEHEKNETTTAVVHYLLERQKDKPFWQQNSNRPPTSGSNFTNTYVGLRALQYFGSDEQEERIEARTEAIAKWLVEAKAKEIEDKVFRLRLMNYVDVGEDEMKEAMTELVDAQRDDGGWAQKADMESDVYATATSVVALMRCGLDASDESVRSGLQFLLDQQKEDGSWHVVTRAKGFQKHFETGFPYVKDQFVSTAASSWAVIALCLTQPETTNQPESKVQLETKAQPETK